MSRQDGSRTIGAVGTALDVLEYMIEHGRVGVTEVADDLDLTKATVHAHLQTLEERRYVLNEGGEYRLGLRSLTVGRTALLDSELYRVGRPRVEQLAETTGGAAQIGVEQHGLGYYLCRSKGPDAVRTDAVVSAEMHLHATAFGKAILAYLPREAVEAVAERHGLPAITERTITTRERLYDELDRIRERGIAFDEGEHIEDVRCVAAPIHDDDVVAGAISVSGSKQRMHGESLRREILGNVAEAARKLESELSPTP